MQNEDPLPEIRCWTGANIFSYLVLLCLFWGLCPPTKLECCSKASHICNTLGCLLSTMLPNFYCTCQWLPHLSLCQMPSQALSRFTYPTVYWTLPSVRLLHISNGTLLSTLPCSPPFKTLPLLGKRYYSSPQLFNLKTHVIYDFSFPHHIQVTSRFGYLYSKTSVHFSPLSRPQLDSLSLAPFQWTTEEISQVVYNPFHTASRMILWSSLNHISVKISPVASHTPWSKIPAFPHP